MQHSDLENPTEGTNEKASEIITALNRGDHETAGVLLRDALEKSPDDKQLLRLAAKQRKQAERFTRVRQLLRETVEAIEGDEFVRAVGAFREAVNLGQGFASLEEATFRIGVDEAARLGERNWRIARTLLEDAGRISPKLVVPEEHWKNVRAAEREETIANVLEETALAKPADLGRARERLMRTLEQYPGDTSLANRLKSIESTIDDKRRWDDRQKTIKKLTDLRDAMQRETEQAQIAKYIPQSEAIAGAYRAEPEFSAVLEDIHHQVTTSEQALTALKQDRIEDCLEHCAWVLSRMRHHQFFLNLKKQAEEREVSLADDYRKSLSEIKDLSAAGKLAEAESLRAKVSAQSPQFADSREPNRKTQDNDDSVRRLLERGERSLREHQYRLAEQSFGSALKVRPDDKKLPSHLMGLLHGYARSIVRDNPQSAEEVLQLTARLLPGTQIPPDLMETVRQKREHAKEEAVRWASLDKLNSLNAQVESAKKPTELHALLAEAARNNFMSAKHADVREAAAALNGKIDGKVAVLEGRRARKPALYRTLALAATLLIGVGLAYWLSNNHSSSGARPEATPEERTIAKIKLPAIEPAIPEVKPPEFAPIPAETAPIASATPMPAPPATGSLVVRSEVPGAQVAIDGKQYTLSTRPLKIELNADSYKVSGSHPGYKDFGPVTVAVGKAAETVLDLKLTPKPANLEIRGADPNTHVKLDGVLLSKAAAGKALNKELPAGEHSIEISRTGFETRKLTRTLAPGEALVLTNRDLQLQSDAATLVAAAPKPPAIARAPISAAPKADELQWQSLDKNNPEALRAFAARYPNSSWLNDAKQQLDTVLVAREDSDWNTADHNNPAALQDFLKKHPDGRHASAATTSLADIDRKSRASLQAQNVEEAAWKKVNPHDEGSLQSYLKDYPGSRYRNTAEVALANIHIGRASATESAAVLTVISRLANAWSAKDLDSILAIQKNLNKREVKAELSHVKALAMQISPASAPQIDGSQAVVLCRRQASQVFSDGTQKQVPESIVSYLLVKHDGNWTIEGTK